MGTSVLPYRYRINGLVDTSKPVLQNLELIGNSCATWLTYDIMTGLWSVVINQAGDPVAAFDDDNIVGAITLSGSGLNELYNAVEVKFPHRDLLDETDWIRIEIPAEDRLPNEPDNVLTMDIPMINEPVQAQIIGLIELKQSRLDKIVKFTTDYSKINIAAGDIITITNSVYGWTDQEFRVIRMEEVDANGTILIDITAIEYSDSVYDLTDLSRYTRTNADGIITQGQIGQCDQPQVTKYEQTANPRIEVETYVPDNTDPLNQAGIVEAVEFWIYQIPDAELPTWESVDDTTRTYTLLATQKPVASNVYEPGEQVIYVHNNIEVGNFLVKTRAVNSTTSGAFSDYSGLVEYDPTQVTDAIGPNTDAIDGSGNSLLYLTAANALLGLLGNAYDNKAAGSGTLFDKLWDIFNDETGTNLKDNIKNGALYGYDLYSNNSSIILWVLGDASTYTDGYSNTINIFQTGPQLDDTYFVSAGTTFTALESGKHYVDASVGGWYSDAVYDVTLTMWKNATWYLYDSSDTIVASFGDSIRGDAYQNIPLGDIVTLTAGETYYFKYWCAFEQLHSQVAGGHNFTVTVKRSRD